MIQTGMYFTYLIGYNITLRLLLRLVNTRLRERPNHVHIHASSSYQRILCPRHGVRRANVEPGGGGLHFIVGEWCSQTRSGDHG